MPKIGFNLLPWTAAVSSKSYSLMDRLKEIGYDGIETLIGSPEEASYVNLAKHAQDLGLEITSVFVLGKDDNPIDSDAIVRSRGLTKIKWAIDRCEAMGAKILCGPFHSAHSHFAYRPANFDEKAWSVEILREAAEYAQEANVVLALEAVNRFETYLCNTMDQLAELLEEVNHPNAMAMYDTHHAHIEEKTIYEPIERISPFLAHVHISENDRGTPGQGLVHWEAVFESLKKVNYEGWYTIESFSRADPTFANMINVWREYSDPWEIAEQGFRFIQSRINA